MDEQLRSEKNSTWDSEPMAYLLSQSKLHFMEDAFVFRRMAYARNRGNDFQTVDLHIFKENVLIPC